MNGLYAGWIGLGLSLGLLSSPLGPAQAQAAMMQDWSRPELAAILKDLQIDKIQLANDQGRPVVLGRTAGKVISITGEDCTSGPEPRCAAFDVSCVFDLTNPAGPSKAIALLSYPGATVRAVPRGVRMNRYVLVAGGVAPDNVRANIMLFVQNMFDAIDRLHEAKLIDPD